MLLTNLCPQNKLVNGSRGVITGFVPASQAALETDEAAKLVTFTARQPGVRAHASRSGAFLPVHCSACPSCAH